MEIDSSRLILVGGNGDNSIKKTSRRVLPAAHRPACRNQHTGRTIRRRESGIIYASTQYRTFTAQVLLEQTAPELHAISCGGRAGEIEYGGGAVRLSSTVSAANQTTYKRHERTS
ncbi:hypothetical protein AVEN_8845-1 [Araneus ventricosus]|uniref:Uncharacterized protein n=1 Tax=Araneus ventricosus TaxID=182803 RepID=A0A4Y2NSS5_ARAVE|nr:hypothetical protein AVEN_8845-1 [Araneus ventricosus]